MHSACLVVAVCQAVRYHVVGLLGRYVGEHGDHADTSQRADRNDLVVVARIDIDDAVSERCEFGNLTDVARCLFDRHDILNFLCKPDGRLGQDVGSRSGRNVVKNAGDIDRAGDRREVLEQSVLCRLVVIGCNEKAAVSAELLSFFGHHDRVGGIVGSRSGNDRDPARCLLNRVPDRLQMLVVFKRRRLAGRSADNDRICVAGDLVLDQRAQHLIIDLSVVFHGRYNSDTRAFENCHFDSPFLF